jgi:hypothetical protein
MSPSLPLYIVWYIYCKIRFLSENGCGMSDVDQYFKMIFKNGQCATIRVKAYLSHCVIVLKKKSERAIDCTYYLKKNVRTP